MEGGSFSKCGSRIGAARICLKPLQEFRGLRAGVSLVEGASFPKCGSGLRAHSIQIICKSFTG
eukprot:7285792-Pyramimonas_sp.AAC.1